MWLTSREICSELRISGNALCTLRRNGKIQFVKLGHNFYRYRLPEPSRLAAIPQIERVGLLAYDELAQILGITRITVRVAVHQHRYHPVAIGKRKYFTILECRRILAEREQRRGQGKRGVSKILVDWMKQYLMNDEVVPVQVLDELIKAAATLPDPGRSQAISKLWNLFDQVDDILKEIQRIHQTP